MILFEHFLSHGKVTESNKAKLPEGVLCRATYQICSIGEKNRNNRVYEQAVWDKVMGDTEIQDKLKNRALFFHAEHPTTTQSNTEKVAGIVTDIQINEDKVNAVMEVLDTPYGRIVDTLLKAGCGIGVSTRADGELEEMTEGEDKYSRVIPESYRFVTIDFTADPSTYGSEIPIKVERELAGVIKQGLDSEKIDREYATVLLEKFVFHAPEALEILESIKHDKHHKGCGCKASEKKCGKGCAKAIRETEETGTCIWCKKQFPLKDMLVTGTVDDEGREELTCLTCDKSHGYQDIKHTDEKMTSSSDKSGQPANAAAADVVAKKSAAHNKEVEAVDTKEQIIDVCRRIVADKSYEKIDGKMVDLYTASLICNVYDALSDENKKKFETLSLDRIVNAVYKLANKESVAEMLKEDVQMKIEIDPKVEQFLLDNWSLFTSDKDAVDNLIKVFKIGEEDAKEYVEEVAKGRGTISAVYAMSNEGLHTLGTPKELSERLASVTAEKKSIAESYANDIMSSAVKINELESDVNSKIVLLGETARTLSETKVLLAQTEANFVTFKTETEKLVADLKESNVAEIKKLNEAHTTELIKTYVSARLNSMGLKVGKNALTLLESCKTHVEVDVAIKQVQDALREGLVQSAVPDSITVTKPVDQAVNEIDRKITTALGHFGA